MKIKQAEYVGSYVQLKQLPDPELPEIAIVGRSNVGKSSLINKLCNRRNLAKSSSTPGKTRTINYYLINQSWYLVDLPGYGFARVSKAERDQWGNMIETYLSSRQSLRGVIMLLDMRHEPGELDIMMKEWLQYHEIPILIVATKADKVSRGARAKHLAVIQRTLNLENRGALLSFSAQTGEGREDLLLALADVL
ncbi:MAG TPA: YihA family ribosome biogenesis GTP-binding protein [Syntrophomonadaceae bacterium]|nr:YihA family ribosome biogenesis GTP-binding protein [Syntrophomonadaceae bacterium]